MVPSARLRSKFTGIVLPALKMLTGQAGPQDLLMGGVVDGWRKPSNR